MTTIVTGASENYAAGPKPDLIMRAGQFNDLGVDWFTPPGFKAAELSLRAQQLAENRPVLAA